MSKKHCILSVRMLTLYIKLHTCLLR